ncbi:Glycosyl hydrolase family 92 [Planctomycetes bacterium CA13]|uniref:Glycosyl hydrolase family 92 n=1 Tax=Novipirellula herctigrandis TaxID=2527986 RepID=A0A5C5ZDE6_9BACT|nr:Glycosyl hydrolase family 92 [Planctomycetes bacterium CA13]
MAKSRIYALLSSVQTIRRCRNLFGHDVVKRFVAATLMTSLCLTYGVQIQAEELTGKVDLLDFSTSFEPSEDHLPLENTVEVTDGREQTQMNVQGKVANSLMDRIEAVIANVENPPRETAVCLADGDAASKWLAFKKNASLRYKLTNPGEAVRYTLTSGNDFPGRDPRDWRLLGSDDGTSWTTLDTQKNQKWEDPQRGVTKSYKVSSPRPYRFYRLDIFSNHFGDMLQLAGWDLIPAEDKTKRSSPMTTKVGSGPSGGYNMKPRAGFTGMHSLKYAGKHTADGRGYATNRIFDVNIPVSKTTRLSYCIFPELTGNDLQYPSTYAAIDLRFSDGTQLSSLDPIDAYDVSATAHGQGSGKVLYPNQWNQVRIELGRIAKGKTVRAIQLSYDNHGATDTTEFQGWIDDIKIEATPKNIDGSSLTHYVDTRRGTNSSSAFSRGSNEAITTIPNGFNFLVPVTNAAASSREYSYQQDNDDQNRPRFEGLGICHQPSPWMGDRNQFSVMPVAGDATSESAPSGDHHLRAVTFRHDNETAQPDYYRVDLDNGVRAEMTPTSRGMLMRFRFVGDSGHVVLDAPNSDGNFSIDPSTGSVTGWVDHGAGFRVGQSRMFVSGTFDQVPTKTGLAPEGRLLTKYATFDTTDNKTVTLRLATSLISLDQAAKNLEMEVGGQEFDVIREQARKIWNDRLDVITVEGASETELVTLYGCLYRLNVYPNAHFENTGTPEQPNYKYASPVSPPESTSSPTETGAKIVSGKMYVNNGFWDTYRTTWPAYSLLYPEIAAELIDGFVDQYRDGGWIARWSSPGYANIMTGTSSDVAFADAYLRGVKLVDPLATYDAAVKNAAVPSDNPNVGRKGLTTSTFLGYTPASEHESVSWATEGFINDFGIGNMAAALAEDPATPEHRRARLREEREYYLSRAKNYVNLFDPTIEFFQARKADGRFDVPADRYDPTRWFGPYTETNGWNFAYHAPQDPNGLANLYGGKTGLEKKLDLFFSTPETSLGPIHEEVEARDGRFGQWGVSNQVSHHVPFIYNAAGAPAKAQKIVREALQRSFTGSEIGQGYPGDEDNGEMSAWYIFNALGLYPMQVGSDQLVVGSPLYEKATIDLGNGKSLVINAPGNTSKTVYVQSLEVNGIPHTSTTINSELFQAGGTLDFHVGQRPSQWGTGLGDGLLSLTTGDTVASPLADTIIASQVDVVSNGGEDMGELIDNSSATHVEFTHANPAATVVYREGQPRPTFYTLTAGSSDSDPSSWLLEGSNDGKSWTVVDKREGLTFSHRRETMPMKIQNPKAFQQFRFTFSSADEKISLSEIELLTDGTQPSIKGDALDQR